MSFIAGLANTSSPPERDQSLCDKAAINLQTGIKSSAISIDIEHVFLVYKARRHKRLEYLESSRTT